MTKARFWCMLALFTLAGYWLSTAHSQPPRPKPAPKPEPVAETKLLMEGLADPNTRALGKLLSNKPADAEAWAFARGQALLIAETANMLLLRPPRTQPGQELWFTYTGELREHATDLARAAANRDYLQARASLAKLANSCNRCHQSFRVEVRIDPFSESP